MSQSVVHSAAKALSLLDGDGRLKKLDSLHIVDVVTELEKRLRMRFPSELIAKEAFASIEAVEALIEAVKKSAAGQP